MKTNLAQTLCAVSAAFVCTAGVASLAAHKPSMIGYRYARRHELVGRWRGSQRWINNGVVAQLTYLIKNAPDPEDDDDSVIVYQTSKLPGEPERKSVVTWVWNGEKHLLSRTGEDGALYKLRVEGGTMVGHAYVLDEESGDKEEYAEFSLKKVRTARDAEN